MASLVLSGDTSGSITVSAPAVSGSNTQTLVAATGTLAPLISGTAVTASGSTVDFTSIPSWVKRITVMLSGISFTGTPTGNTLLLLGTGGTPTYATSGYANQIMTTGASSMNTANFTTGFAVLNPNSSTILYSATYVLTNLSGNIWTFAGSGADASGTRMYLSSGEVTLSAALTALRVDPNSTDTFDAGSINILYE
jgi:hypothetical protein